MKKYLAEMFGTMVLVLMGCGVAMSLNCSSDCSEVVNAGTVIGTALAFGLAVVAMAYTIGGISGCHINPAITFGCWLSKRMSGKDALCYIIFQIIGAFIGAAILLLLYATANPDTLSSALGANNLQSGITWQAGLIAEIVFTCVFVLVVLGATAKTNGATNNFAGLAIGLSLVLVHLVCIRYTGTSVNPARSIGPAFLAYAADCANAGAVVNLWIFIVGPLVGAAIAALIWKLINMDKD